MQYCDQTGTTIYFTDTIIVPVMTMDELQAIRNRLDTLPHVDTGYPFLDRNNIYTAVADWFKQTFSSRILQSSYIFPPRFESQDLLHLTYIKDIMHAHNIYNNIVNSGMPFVDGVQSGRYYKLYTSYIKTDTEVYGPITIRLTNANDNPSGNVNNVGIGWTDGMMIGTVSSGNANTQISNRNGYTNFQFCFFVEKGPGLELHYTSPSWNGPTISGYLDGDYAGNQNSVWRIHNKDESFPLNQSIYIDSSPSMQAIIAAPNEFTDDDPYSPGGTTDPQGGDGDFDDGGEDVDFSDLPTIGAANSGFVSLYTPSESQLRALATYMWSNNLFDLEQWKKIFADPMDAIIGLSIVPVTPTPSGTPNVRIGNLTTNVQMTATNQQFCNFDCGTLNVSRFYGSYLDQDPLTHYDIYLPYIGIRPLSADDIADKTLHLMYHIDILSGACIAELKVGGTVLYSFAGQCAAPVPLTSINWSSAITGAMSLGASIGAAIATGGATAPLTAAGMASGSLNQLKPQIEKSGSIGSTSGMLAGQKPYIIRSRPEQAIPQKQNQFIGYPSFITSELNMITGYTEVESIHLENIPATADEIAEIETLLKNGVIL